MKQLILTLTLAIICLIGFSQTNVYRGSVTTVINALDLSTISGADTTIYVAFPVQFSPVWSTEITWATITGSGTIALMVSYDGTNFWAYNTSPSATVTGASGDYEFEDDRFIWVYLGFKITKSTISVGTLTAKILLK